jgi:CheY-like chemotaxis protein/anti-sigma regulatory factor (Ser/Thr protein kinase)
VTLEVVLELEKVPYISGCAPELREALMNLIFNAVDAMPHGGTITIRSRQDAGRVLIEIADSGTGMTEEVRLRCFEPFFSTKGEEGTGLGLAMVFGILTRHDALVEIESQPGQGTTFRLRFPEPDEIKHETAAGETRMLAALRVLVVDDEHLARDVLARYLKADGHEVECVANGEDALLRLQTDGIDLLVADHGMPGMNGIQLIDAARAFGHRQPAILLTSIDLDPLDKPTSVQATLRKPIRKRDLQKLMAGIERN